MKKERYRLGERIRLADLIEGKWESYPVVRVPSKEVVDYEKAYELLKGYDWIGVKTNVDRGRFLVGQFLVMLMMEVGEEAVLEEGEEAIVHEIFSEWIEFYRGCCEMFGFEDTSKSCVVTSMFSSFCFHVKHKKAV